MVKLSERFLDWMKTKYAKKGLPWNRSDEIIWGFWVTVAPWLIWVPILFWILKLTFINYMYNHYGFEKTIIYLAIIMIIRPTLMEALHKILTFKEEMKKEI